MKTLVLVALLLGLSAPALACNSNQVSGKPTQAVEKTEPTGKYDRDQ